jgi:oligopeptide transport system substrate-binding protein
MYMNTKTSFYPLLALGLSFVLAKGAVHAAPGQAAPIRIQLGGEPSTLDPVRAMDQYGFGILRNVVEGLFTLDGEGRLRMGLAKSHEVSKDGLVHRFRLREDAKWSDGKSVTLEDCIFGLRNALDPKNASPSVEFLFAIKNARDVFSGKKSLASLGVTRKGDELVIELERPDPAFLHELTLPLAAPMREELWKKHQGRWEHTFPVTGDYRIATYRPAEQIELVPNEFRPKPARHPVTYRIFPEEITAMNLFESGHLDVISTITPTEIARLRKKDLIRMVPSTTVFYFSFNVSRPPFDDASWRKAVAAAVDREGLEKVLHGAFVATGSYLPSSIDGHRKFDTSAFAADAKKLKALKSKPRVRLAYGSSAFTRVVAEKVQQDLQKELGLQVSLEPMELKSLLGLLKSDPPDMYFLGMSAVFNDPSNHLNAFSSSVAPNFSRYQSREYEELLGLIRTLEPGPKRNSLIEAAQALLVEKDVVVVPMVNRLQVFGVSKSLKNFQVSPYQAIHLRSLEK